MPYTAMKYSKFKLVDAGTSLPVTTNLYSHNFHMHQIWSHVYIHTHVYIAGAERRDILGSLSPTAKRFPKSGGKSWFQKRFKTQ